jgi:Na+/H+-dicarboxylate symporter
MTSETVERGKLPLHWQILIAMSLAVAAGVAVGKDGLLFGYDLVGVFDLMGKLFMNAMKLLVVPLVMASVICGVASLGQGRDLGRIGGRTLAIYVGTTFIAVMVALVVSHVVLPGEMDGAPVGDRLAFETSSAEVAEKVEARSSMGIGEVLLTAVPDNILAAAASTNLLALVVFSILFGYFITRIDGAHGMVVRDFWQGVFDVMLKFTEFVMRFAPYGVFGLVAETVAKSGFDAAQPLVVFSLSVVAGLAIFALVLLPLLLWIVGRVRPFALFPVLSPALLTAFSTASSSATLPMVMDCLEKRGGVSNRVCGFVLPLGATMNQAGSALYECAAVMFIAQAYGLDLSFADQVTIVVLSLVTSMGVAGVPAASLVAITVILTSIGLPPEAIGVLLVFDRLLDMLRTVVNVFGDGVAAVIVARLEGEENLLRGLPADGARAG